MPPLSAPRALPLFPERLAASPRALGAVALVAAVTGAASVWNPLVALGTLASACVLSGLWLTATSVPRIVLTMLATALAGYAFFSRGFAYVGVRPIFAGEVVLGAGLLGVLTSRDRHAGPLASPVVPALAAFAALGAWRTAPFVATHGFDAFRDAALWGYGAFALVAAVMLAPPDRLARLTEIYQRLAPYFLGWVPVLAVLVTYADPWLPRLDGDVTIPTYKPDDVGVHLAGIACFLLLGLGRRQNGARHPSRTWSTAEWACWALFTVDVVITSTLSRSGTLAIVLAVGLVLIVRPAHVARRLAAIGLVGALVGAMVLGAMQSLALSISLDSKGVRQLSAEQIVANLASVVGHHGNSVGLQGSREWRLLWWGSIVDYTVSGPYFWTGKGFGVNLADDDGFQVTSDNSLRSPHNVHMTVLARMGVPGLVGWLLLQLTFAITMARGYRRARRRHDDWRARFQLWILAYWLAFLVDASFDVFLEGPAGGIWFWTLMGIGLAAAWPGQRPAPAHPRPMVPGARPTLSAP